MSESDGGGGNSGNGSRKRSNSTAGAGRTSPSPPRNALFDKGAVDGPAAAAVAPAPAPTPGPSSKKKQKKGSRGSSTGVQAFVPPGVVISRSPEDCAPQLTMPNKDQLTVVGNKGFRMARATHGVSNGTWYWECTVLPPETKEGHCRLGWSLPTGSLQAPVGYDKSSYAYRDIAGSKVHESLRTDNYGEPWGEGDVIGFLIKLKSPSEEEMIDTVGAASDSGRLSVAAAAAALAAGQSPSERAAKAAEAVAAGGANAFNEIRFFKNGRDQGVAFSGIKPGTYFPAVSLYMGGSVRANFGPEFVYPPPRSYGWKPVAALRPFTKDEIKSQRNTIKRERAARGLETATRLIGGAPPLPSLNGGGNASGNGSASSRSASPPPAAPSKNGNNPGQSKGSRREGEGSERGRAFKSADEGTKRPDVKAAKAAEAAPAVASGKAGRSLEVEVEEATAAAAVVSRCKNDTSKQKETEGAVAIPAPASDDSKRESKVTPPTPVTASGKKEESKETETGAAGATAAVPSGRATEDLRGTAPSATATSEKEDATKEEKPNGEKTPAASPQRPHNGVGRPTDANSSSEGGGNGEKKQASGEMSMTVVEAGAVQAAAGAAAASTGGQEGHAGGLSPMNVEEEGGGKGRTAASDEVGAPRVSGVGGSSGSSSSSSKPDGKSREADGPSKAEEGTNDTEAARLVATATDPTVATLSPGTAVVSNMDIDDGDGGSGSRDGGLNDGGVIDAVAGGTPVSSPPGSGR